MDRREMSVERYEEIKRLIGEGQSDRQIARALKCRRDKVSEIRKGQARDPAKPIVFKGPIWAQSIDWKSVIEELGYKHPLKYIWEEKAQSVTSYPNFWKVFYAKYPHLQKALSVPRYFEPGERVEVDWAGGKVEWIDPKNGEIHEATVFVSCLGYSQLIFAWASENMKSRSFLEAHRKMYEFYGGVSFVTAPDCTKTAVIKCHLYDPDLNPGYVELASYYKTAIVPARPYHPKDKALVEGAVKLVMRYLRWLYRRHSFLSIAEINRALLVVIDKINHRAHSRFGVSRWERFEKFEKEKLKSLPPLPFEACEWKEAILHPDCTLFVAGAYYSAPHIHRGRTFRVKMTENLIELYLDGERVATHTRDRWQKGRKVINPEHFPENAKAYYEATPKNLLCQARFLSSDLHLLIEELFKKETLGNIRIVQGLIRVAKKHVSEGGPRAAVHLSKAITTMRTFNRYRVAYFKELLTLYRKEILNTEDREITRKPGNPMLRYADDNQLLLPITETNKQEGVPHGNRTI